MKRAISILFLACANLILLAHATIPHHHHDGMAVGLMLQDEKHCHDSTHSHSHDHSKDGSSENCYLNNIIARFLLNNEEDDGDFDNSHHYPILYVLYSFQLEEIALKGMRILHKPYLVWHHAVPDISSNGLRAPPIC